MPFTSLHSIRGVVDSFLHKSAAIPVESFTKEKEEGGSAYDKARDEVSQSGHSYDAVLGRVLGDILQDIIPIPDDPSSSSFWGDEEVLRLLHMLPKWMTEWMGKALGKKMAASLNRVFGSYTYKLFRGSRQGSPMERKPVAIFEDHDMKPNRVMDRFAQILKEDTGKDLSPESMREQFTFSKEPKQFYDESDLKTQVNIKAHTAVDEVVNLITSMAMDPSILANRMAEKRLGRDMSTTWIRPPRGKPESAQEQTSQSDRRKMDPAVADFMFNAMESGRPVRWNYSGVEVAPGREGDSVMLLRAILPKLGGREYTMLVPGDIGVAIREARPGEEYTFKVLDYDPSKGFKVSFSDFKDRMVANTKKSLSKTGVSAKQLKSALLGIIDDHAAKLFGHVTPADVSAAAERFLGRVEVDGRNIATDQGMKDLIDFHEQRQTQRDPRGAKGKDEDESGVLKRFEQRKRETEEERVRQEELVGRDVAWIQHELADHVNKAAEKIADKISRRFPKKAPFTGDMRTWTFGNALKSRDGIRWLVSMAVDESLEPTKHGSIPWKSLTRGVLTSDVLEDPVRTEKMFGGAYEEVLSALKVAMVASNPQATKEQKQGAVDDYMKGTLKVTPEDRRAVARALSSKSKDAIRMIIDDRAQDIARAFIDMYNDGDPDIQRIVEVSKAQLPPRMTSEEKEEWDVDPKKRKVTTTFKHRLEEARGRMQEERDKNADKAREIEHLLLSGDYSQAGKLLKGSKANNKATLLLESLSKSAPAGEGTEERERQMVLIEQISDLYESALNEASDVTMRKKLKLVGNPKKEIPEKGPEDKIASLYASIVKIAYPKALV